MEPVFIRYLLTPPGVDPGVYPAIIGPAVLPVVFDPSP
jgi:hypothetical protein